MGKQEGEELMQEKESDKEEWVDGCHGSATQVDENNNDRIINTVLYFLCFNVVCECVFVCVCVSQTCVSYSLEYSSTPPHTYINTLAQQELYQTTSSSGYPYPAKQMCESSYVQNNK